MRELDCDCDRFLGFITGDVFASILGVVSDVAEVGRILHDLALIEVLGDRGCCLEYSYVVLCGVGGDSETGG